jgi:hypothetical protein
MRRPAAERHQTWRNLQVRAGASIARQSGLDRAKKRFAAPLVSRLPATGNGKTPPLQPMKAVEGGELWSCEPFTPHPSPRRAWHGNSAHAARRHAPPPRHSRVAGDWRSLPVLAVPEANTGSLRHPRATGVAHRPDFNSEAVGTTGAAASSQPSSLQTAGEPVPGILSRPRGTLLKLTASRPAGHCARHSACARPMKCFGCTLFDCPSWVL